MALKISRLLAVFVFLTTLTYAGTVNLGVRIYPAEVSFLIYLAFGATNWRKYLVQVPRTTVFAYLILLLFLIESFIPTLAKVPGFVMSGFIKEVARYVLCGLCFFVITGWMRQSPLNIRNLKRYYIYASNFVSLYGIYQFSMCLFTKRYVSILPNSSPVPNVNGRAVGTFFEGGYMALFVGAAIFILIREKEMFRRRIFLGSLSLNILALLATQSTGGILAILISFLYMRLTFRINMKMIIAAMLCIVSLYVGYFLFKTKIDASIRFFSTMNYSLLQNGLGSESAADRITKVLKAVNMFTENPIFGVGLGQYSWLYDDYLPYSLTDDIGSVVPLNVFVQLLAENGLVGFFCVSIFFAVLWSRSDKSYRGLLLYVLISMNFYPTYKFLFMWVLFALIFSSGKQRRSVVWSQINFNREYIGRSLEKVPIS
jgi:O-antigen ligase